METTRKGALEIKKDKQGLRLGNSLPDTLFFFPRPHEGAKVLAVINRKDSFGTIPLRVSVEIGREVFQLLNDKHIPYSPIGASAFGIGINLPPSYLNSRVTSNLFDIQVPKEFAEPTTMALSGAGWNKKNAVDYFSVTFEDAEGKKQTVPSIPGQGLFSKKQKGRKLFLTVIFLPTEFYQARNGHISIIGMEAQQTLGESMAYKLLRSRERDIKDMANIASSNNLAYLLGESGLKVIKDSIRRGAGIEGFHQTVGNITEELKKANRRGAGTIIKANIRLLSELKSANAEEKKGTG